MQRIIKLPKEGDERVTRKFLWRPMSFRNREQIDWRWLEFVYTKQRYARNYATGYLRWTNNGFETKDWKTKKAVDKMLNGAK